MKSLDAETRSAIERLMTEFAWRIDHGQADRVHELFVEAGTVSAPGLALNSREEIATTFAKRARDKSRVSRHLWSNPRYEILGEDRVGVTTVVQTFMASLSDDEELPVANNTFIVGDSNDVVRRDTDHRWLFESRQLQVLFAPQNKS